MNEMIDQFFFLLGCVILVGIPLVSIATFFAYQGEKLPDNELDAKRLNDNLEIVQLLTEYIENHPSQRFGQVLRNTGIIQDVGVKDSSKPEWETPTYYIDRILIHEEPGIILERMEKELAKN